MPEPEPLDYATPKRFDRGKWFGVLSTLFGLLIILVVFLGILWLILWVLVRNWTD
jgi:hypothetical protein